jgi:cobalamin biosynthesis protein CobT
VQEIAESAPPEILEAEETKQPEPEMSLTIEEHTEANGQDSAKDENGITSSETNGTQNNPLPESLEEASEPANNNQTNTIPEEDEDQGKPANNNQTNTIPEEDEDQEKQVESSEPKTNGNSKEDNTASDSKEGTENLKGTTSSSRQPVFQEVGLDTPESRTSRHDRVDSTTPSPGRPRRSRSVKDSFQAYYKVFKSRANRNRSPPRDEAAGEELQRLRKSIRTYEKQLEEASDTILLQDRVLTRWEKLNSKVRVFSTGCAYSS